jgi:beta-galactosidase
MIIKPNCVALLFLLTSTVCFADPAPREHLSMDGHWRFVLADPADGAKPAMDDSAWRTIDLPHDWSIEGQFDAKAPTGGAGGFLPTGIGWYRRTINAPQAWHDRRVDVMFEGVYMNADVFLNGEKLATHPYGYTSFAVDLTGHLHLGQPNLLAVRVDNSQQKNTRWYSGSGLYRHVWLDVTGPVHLASDVGQGVYFSTTAASGEKATVHAVASITNDGASKSSITVQVALLAPDGTPAGQNSVDLLLAPGETKDVALDLDIPQPQLWSPRSPILYTAATRLLEGQQVMDQEQTAIGIRMLRWSADQGITINGQSVKLCGGCVHHDNGPLGSAAFDRAEARRVEVLKAAGFNAIRTSHNPPSPAFLAACDRLGMLVMDESFDCWEQGKNAHDYHVAFHDWWQRDIDSMVLRDRNHPSVIIWSVGNEIPERFKPSGVEEAKMLVRRVHALDPTRPVASANNGGPNKPQPWTDSDTTFDLFDIAGYNYNLSHQKEDHERRPQRIMVATESFPRSAVEYWKYAQNPYVIGEFVWTALDYLGESGIGRSTIAATTQPGGHGGDDLFPWHGAFCGDIDCCGFRKYQSFYRNILWDRGEKLHMVVDQPVPPGMRVNITGWGVAPALESWTWPGQEGKPLTVEVFTRYPTVRLMLDDKVIEEKSLTDADHCRLAFTVPYAPGVLKAIGLRDGQPAEQDVLETANAAHAIHLTADRPTISADGQDLSFVKVEITDEQGRLCPDAAQQIKFQLEGPGTIAAVGNADMTSTEPYQGDTRRVFHGVALVVVRAGEQAGEIQLRAQAEGLSVGMAKIESRPVDPQPSVP